MVEATDCWMDKMKAKQNQQEENSRILEAGLNMKKEMIARMMEEMRSLKQEKETLTMQNQNMMMIMSAEAEQQVQREDEEREEREEKLRAQAQLKRSEEAREALKAEMDRLRDLLSKEENEQRKSAQYSIIGTENLKKLGERITKESERIRAKLAFRKQRNGSQIIDSTIEIKFKSSDIGIKEETEERTEQHNKTTEHIKREAVTETTEQRKE